MYLDALYALLHYLAIFVVFVSLSIELVLCKGVLDAAAVQRLGRIDIVFFVAAMLALGTGLLRALLGVKGWWFYAGNIFFWIKLSTFVVIGLVSIAPTVAFIRWRKKPTSISAIETGRARRYLFWETLLLPILPICAVLMARGIGVLS
jgi:putative membrane protein